MKTAPFDLQKALAGHPLVTRGGKIKKGFRRREPNDFRCGLHKVFPFIIDSDSDVSTYTSKGTYWFDGECDGDLLLLLPDEAQFPEPPKESLPQPKQPRDNHGRFVAQKQSTKQVVVNKPKQVSNKREVLPLVIADLCKRGEKGIETYGVPLTTHNGRNALIDDYEEVLDLACYLRQEIEEQKGN